MSVRRRLETPGADCEDVATPAPAAPGIARAVEDLAALQRTAGNQAVVRMLSTASGMGLRRYTVSQAEDYHPAGSLGGTPHFPFQRLEQEIDEPAPLDWSQPLVYRAEYADTSASKPALRVADDGSMAIQDATLGGDKLAIEPKTFYATDALIEQSNRQLAIVKSAVHLGHTGKEIDAPLDPKRPEQGRHRLRGVQPQAPPQPGDVGAREFAINVNECTQVAAALMGEPIAERGVAIFESPAGQRAQADLDLAQHLGSKGQHQMAAYAASGGAAATPAGMAAQLTTVASDAAPVPATRRVYAEHFERALAEGRLAGPVDDDVLDQLARPTTPRAAADEIVARLLRRERIDRTTAEILINGYREYTIAQQYGQALQTPGGAAAAQPLGINAAAMPQVGEAFITASIGTPHIQVAGGGQLDFTVADAAEQQQLLERLEDNKQKLQIIKQLVSDGLHSLATNIWGWHAATVVARSGMDSVTLENYNRGTTANQALDRFWAHFARVHANAAAEIDRAMKEKGFSSASSRARLEQLLREVAAGVGEFAGLDVRLVENLEKTKSESRWYFQMYGPAEQSFHETWKTTGFVQPLTLRVGSAVPSEPAFLDAVERMLKARVEELVPDEIRGSGNHDRRKAYRRHQRHRLEPFTARIATARTRGDVAQITEEARAAIEAGAREWKQANLALVAH